MPGALAVLDTVCSVFHRVRAAENSNSCVWLSSCELTQLYVDARWSLMVARRVGQRCAELQPRWVQYVGFAFASEPHVNVSTSDVAAKFEEVDSY